MPAVEVARPATNDEPALKGHTQITIRRTTKQDLKEIGPNSSMDRTIRGLIDVTRRERKIEKVRRAILGVLESGITPEDERADERPTAERPTTPRAR